jgi:cyanophycinase
MHINSDLTQSAGSMILIGGGGAGPESHLARIFSRLITLAGGPDAPIVILTCATSTPERQAHRTSSFLAEQGAREIFAPMIRSRADADDPATAALISEARAIYLTGGDQSKYLRILSGTRSGEALRTAYQHGTNVIGGTSAGAVVMSDVMIAASYDWVMAERGIPCVRHGFGLLGDGVVIDSHFSQRRRIPRLVTVIETLPGVLGIGLDEDTALIVGPDGVAEVIGFSRVYFFQKQGKRVRYTTATDGDRVDLQHVFSHRQAHVPGAD